LSVPTVALDFRMRYLLPMLDAELRAQVPGYSKLRGLQVKTRGIFNANAANYKPKIFKSNDAGRRPPAEHAGAIRAAAMQRGVPEFLKVQLLRMAEKCEGKS
ncbi:MAG: hypothetical protein GY862_13260, partial [Gammaproteobacteria bacterium]|nr:hypothetical protein [Gammaproteobacteria bacterium]